MGNFAYAITILTHVIPKISCLHRYLVGYEFNIPAVSDSGGVTSTAKGQTTSCAVVARMRCSLASGAGMGGGLGDSGCDRGDRFDANSDAN